MSSKHLLHVAERLSSRGGADHHMLSVLTQLQARGWSMHLHVLRDDRTTAAPCSTSIGVEVDLSADLIHLHNVMDPELILSAPSPKVMTVQDHRIFCPGRGKWTANDAVCRSAMSPEICAPCFEDRAYHHRVQTVTARRLEALRTVDHVVVLSEYMKRELQQVGVERVTVVPPFVFDLESNAPVGEPCVLYVGRVVTAKGVDDAVAAWRMSGVDLPLVVAGTGRERTRLELDGVTVLGWVDRPTLAGLYRRARAVIMPSRWQEPFGIVGLEALQCGTPVVAWRSGGVEEWHPGPLSDWGDVRALAEALRAAVLERAQPAPGFEPEPLMRRLEAVYREVLQ